jgi:hypothetical protein
MAASRQAAWDAYIAVSRRLLPAIADPSRHGPAVGVELDGVVVRIRRYAPMWGEDGQMLLAAVRSVVRLYADGDRDQLASLLHAISDRLYRLSIEPGGARRT